MLVVSLPVLVSLQWACPRESECTLLVVVVLVLVGEAKHQYHLVGKVLAGVVKTVREKCWRHVVSLCCNLLVW